MGVFPTWTCVTHTCSAEEGQRGHWTVVTDLRCELPCGSAGNWTHVLWKSSVPYPSHLSSPEIFFYGFLPFLVCSISGISERPRKRHSSRDTRWTLRVHSCRYGGYSLHLTPEHGLTPIKEIHFVFCSIVFKFKIKSKYFTCGKL